MIQHRTPPSPPSIPSTTTSSPDGPELPSPERLLDAVPVQNQAAVVRERKGQRVVYVPLADSWLSRPPMTWVFPIRKEKGYALDALGFEVFDACDGTRDCEQLIEEFADRHRLRFHEARVAVNRFLQMLVQRRLIAVVIRQEDATTPLTETDSEVTVRLDPTLGGVDA